MAGKKIVTDNTSGLAKELRSLIPKLDEEGLSFLLEQAQIHLHNMEVDRINRAEAARAEAAPAKTAGRTKPAVSAKTAKGTGEIFRIEGTESGSSYYIVYGNEWIMFSRDEITHLVKLVNAGGSDLETRERLFNWLDRERRDMLGSTGIKDKFDDRLKVLTALIKKTFKVR
jgi:hypothetical protein